MVVYLAADLIWATRIKATSEDSGVPCRPVRTMEMLDARLEDSPVKALIVDLDAGPLAKDMIARMRGDAAGERERAVKIIAFGPHVQHDELDAARRAGADIAMTRGAFDRRLGEVLLTFGV